MNLVYRVRMLSIYGIMARRCGNCNFQFFSTLSYDHHRKSLRCDTYKSIDMPSKEKQQEICSAMRPSLVKCDESLDMADAESERDPGIGTMDEDSGRSTTPVLSNSGEDQEEGNEEDGTNE